MRLRRVRDGRWQVLAVCTERGDCPLLEFLTGLEGTLAPEVRRMLKLLDRVSDQGPPRNTEISHQLEGEIWELIQGRLRVLWFYDEGSVVICSHGFVKKSRKTPVREIRRARECRQGYFRAKQVGRTRIEDNP